MATKGVERTLGQGWDRQVCEGHTTCFPPPLLPLPNNTSMLPSVGHAGITCPNKPTTASWGLLDSLTTTWSYVFSCRSCVTILTLSISQSFYSSLIFTFFWKSHKIFDARHMRKPRAGSAFVVFWLLGQLLVLLAAVEKCSLWLKRTAATRATSWHFQESVHKQSDKKTTVLTKRSNFEASTKWYFSILIYCLQFDLNALSSALIHTLFHKFKAGFTM